MNELSPSASLQPKRKHRRFPLQYPVLMKAHFAGSAIELEGISRNVSVGGLLMETSSLIPQHTVVSFVITIRGKHVVRPMQFTGEGKVVRVDTESDKAAFAIAVQCQRPIIQLDEYLGATGS